MGAYSVRMDDRELQSAFRKAPKEVKQALRKAFGRIMSDIKYEQKQRAINMGHSSKRIGSILATSLNYGISTEFNHITATFGSTRIPSFRPLNKTDSFTFSGALTPPDDDGNQFNIGQAFQIGVPSKTFNFKRAGGVKGGAATIGREIGRSGSNSQWLPPAGVRSTAYRRLDYVGNARRNFERRIEPAVKRVLDRHYNGKF
jgi:hypothetical protein